MPYKDLKYTLYNGTKVIQTRQYGSIKVLGLVIRTGFLTMKGGLVRDILYPKQNNFKFYQDSMLFVAIMAAFALFGSILTLPSMLKSSFPTEDVLDRVLDLITIAVPPALPFAMTTGTIFALNRL